MSERSTPRRVALEVMRAVRVDDAYANLLLPTRIERAQLRGRDAAFTTELTYGTLRMLGYYDLVIEEAARRPTSEIDQDVLDILRLGAHQLLSLRTASHAAVNESVDLVREIVGRKATGFVNGVLRTISRTTPEVWRERVLTRTSGVDAKLAAVFSHPEWIVAALREALEAEGSSEHLDEELSALLEADNRATRPTLVALPGLDIEGLEGTDPSPLSPVGRVLRSDTELASVVALKGGTVRVQDEGSQLAALVLSRARPINAGERWLDLCAGPGGKSALLGAEATRAEATLIANEVSPARAGLVRNALAVLSPVPEVWEEDGRTLGREHPDGFDRVLVDAPCTGLGALRRRPEARWRRQISDVAPLVALQTELVDSAVEALRPGGLLAYVTCSPHVKETREQVDRLQDRHPELHPLDVPAILANIAVSDLGLPSDSRFVQLWPHRHGTDAMFISLFERQ